jgi:3-deoxy-manno-octulosonate cytidylyltransferase (CMP-KDO synthetase)
MNPIILIPARMAATRLPGKPLADIGGKPMIARVVEAAVAADIGPVVVAAADSVILGPAQNAGACAVLTDPALSSGSDRIYAALAEVDPDARHDVIVNLQGDMPFIPPEAIRASLEVMARGDGDLATLVAPESGPGDRTNPDVVKAILALDADGQSGRALYFTRSNLYGDGPVLRHIGLYAYRRAALAAFTGAPHSPLELREGLEQLRALELGLTIRAAIISEAPLSVDSPADLEAARRQEPR